MTPTAFIAIQWGVGSFLALALAAPGTLLTPAQQEKFRERQVLDPRTDEWVDQARPEAAGAPAEPVDQARAFLAQHKPRQARNLLTKWTKRNADHERYYEAMYLLGEAYFDLEDFYKAYQSYEVVAEATSGDLFQQTARREIDCARAFFAGKPRIVWRIFKLPAYDDGVEILNRVYERIPGTPLGEVALRLKADYYFKNGDMGPAQDEFANLAKEFPAGRYTQTAMLRSAEAADAAFPGVKFDDRPLAEAEERYHQVQAAYPEYAKRESVGERLEAIRQKRADKDLDIARYYEYTKHPGAAQYYYRLIISERPDTLAASEARQRLRAMGIELEREESQP
jgi:outer membrane protein assembly factor BamD (BamD/ComL family)